MNPTLTNKECEVCRSGKIACVIQIDSELDLDASFCIDHINEAIELRHNSLDYYMEGNNG